jgi:hypothetical protein
VYKTGGQGRQLPPPQNFRKALKFGQMIGIIKKIWADLSEKTYLKWRLE